MNSRLNFIIIIFFSAFGYSQTNTVVRIKHFNLDEHIALKGYDPVSYFKGKPEKGLKANVFTYQKVDYYFASEANLNEFRLNPGKYEPEFGGWCAYAMGSDGSKVEVDPETYKIIGGRLFLYYNFYFNNTLKKWNSNEPALKVSAEKNWNNLISK